MISASAAMRTISSSQLWIRRRWIDLYGICRTNISDGNGWICFFSRWIRWISTGMARPASATKKRGARKFIATGSVFHGC